MGEEAVIEDELYNSIYDTMLYRLQDKVPAVRVQAVMAVARLQDPRNKECPVIRGNFYIPPLFNSSFNCYFDFIKVYIF